MDIVVVYESLFGNTRAIAEAIAAGAREADPDTAVSVLAVAEAAPERVADATLVIVGGPTHVRGMSKPSTRRQGVLAAEKTAAERKHEAAPAAILTEGAGIREWLNTLPAPPSGRMAAAFDTRLASPLAGGAARVIARRLRRAGYDVIGKPMGFVVNGGLGPLRLGERDRARAWGTGLVRDAAKLVRARAVAG